MSVALEIFPTNNNDILIRDFKSESVFSTIFPDLEKESIQLRSFDSDSGRDDSMPLENSMLVSPASTSLHIYKQKKDETFTTEDFIEGLTIHLSQPELDEFIKYFSVVDHTYSVVSKSPRHALELKMLVAATIALSKRCKGFITIVEPFSNVELNVLYSPEEFYQEMKKIGVI